MKLTSRYASFRAVVGDWPKKLALWFYVGTLAWAPFPLGSNRPWSLDLLLILIALCSLAWSIAPWYDRRRTSKGFEQLYAPITLSIFVLAWSLVQASSFVPKDWGHPIWAIAAGALGQPPTEHISLNPWRTLSECLKLASYIIASILSFQISRSSELSRRLLVSIVTIGAAYALYAFVLHFLGYFQYQLFYDGPAVDTGALAGPFVQRNNFATYSGLITLCALALILSSASTAIVANRGPRQLWASSLNFVLGSSAWLLLAFLLSLCAVIATSSRAGIMATSCAMLVYGILYALTTKHRTLLRWRLVGTVSVLIIFGVTIWLNDGTLIARLSELANMDAGFEARAIFWHAAMRMICDAPLLGLGLGTFQDAYPLYSNNVVPLIVDKAHNDYLEFAAGVGLPAAIAWWTAVVWLVVKCVRGAFKRRLDKHYAILGVATSVLVGTHSALDFSLQIPAVALTFATLLGMGVAQSMPRQIKRV